MTLSLNNPFRNDYGEGVFISLVTIVDVEDISGSTPPFMNFPIDIGLKLHLDVGKGFYPQMIIAGNFQRNFPSDEVSGWGSAFVVQDFLNKLGFTGRLNKDNKIPVNIIQSIIGKKFYRLSYVSGIKEDEKLKYSDWNIISTEDEGAEYLADKFYKSVLKGYPKNYRPELANMEEYKQSSHSNNGQDQIIF